MSTSFLTKMSKLKAKIRFDILTLFPDYFVSPLKASLLGKALEKGLLEINTYNIRSSASDKHGSVDDSPYGGGVGMIMRVDVLSEALEKVKGKRKVKVVLLDPGGKVFNQALAASFAKEKELILVCGRYEGVDQRFKDLYVDEEVSVGDFVLSGGEVAALAIAEATSRLIPGVLGKTASLEKESFSLFSTQKGPKKLLEYPQYTRPEVFRHSTVPDVLLSGNHEKISNWRLTKALERTKKLRPDLLI